MWAGFAVPTSVCRLAEHRSARTGTRGRRGSRSRCGRAAPCRSRGCSRSPCPPRPWSGGGCRPEARRVTTATGVGGRVEGDVQGVGVGVGLGEQRQVVGLQVVDDRLGLWRAPRRRRSSSGEPGITDGQRGERGPGEDRVLLHREDQVATAGSGRPPARRSGGTRRCRACEGAGAGTRRRRSPRRSRGPGRRRVPSPRR